MIVIFSVVALKFLPPDHSLHQVMIEDKRHVFFLRREDIGDALLVCESPKIREDLLQEGHDVVFLHMQLHVAAFQLAEVQQLVDEPEQSSRAALCHLYVHP